MNKKLLIAAVGAALVAGPMLAAQADTTVYGHFHMSLDSYDNGGAGPVGLSSSDAIVTNVKDTTNGMLSSNSTRFGIKGNEDLGGGLKAIYQVESPAFNADDGSGGFNGTLRNTYMGLAGSSWGSVKFGRHDAPVKDLSRKVDAFNEEIGDMRTLVGYQAFDNRVSNMVRYDSPSFSGIQFALQYGASEVNSTFTTTSGNVTYGQGPLYLGLGYEVHSFHDSNSKEESDIRLVGKFDITSELYVGALYDNVSNVDGFDSEDGKAWALFGGFKMANNLFKLQYVKMDAIDKNPDTGATLWAIGVDHNFSKTTKAYLDYAKADNEDNMALNVSSNYGGHSSSSAIPSVAAGKSPSAISLGMIVNF